MLSCRKAEFSLPAELHYLNCAYMSPLSKVVEAAGVEALARKRVPTSIALDDFFEPCDHARQLFARLIGAPDPQRVAIIPAVSYGLAVVARNTRLEPRQNVVVAGDQFPSNVLVWRRLCAAAGAELRVVAAPEGAPGGRSAGGVSGNGRGIARAAAWQQRLLEAIDGGTAVVALGTLHWTDGTLYDLEAIGARAREVGAAYVLDGTQSVGALPFDVARVRPDALICAGYKWLMGPYAIGFAYLGERYDGGEPLEETWIARAGSDDFRGLVDPSDDYRPGAIRYDMGERSQFTLLPLQVAALEQILGWGVASIQDYCAALIQELVAEARELGYGLEDDRWRASHLFGIRVPERLDRDRLQRALADRNVSVSMRGSAVRISPHVYNDEADVGALADALRDAVR